MVLLACTTQDGKALTDGMTVSGLQLQHGSIVRTVSGTVRAFHVNDAQIIATQALLDSLIAGNIVAWEVSTTDPNYPAIGFLPENALTRSGL